MSKFFLYSIVGLALAVLAAVLPAEMASAAEPVSTCDGFAEEQCHINNSVVILKIDVMQPFYDFEMVMAKDSTDGHQYAREMVREMVIRDPYRSRDPIIAFNANYFGAVGPIGLIVKDGVRIRNAGMGAVTEHIWSSFSLADDHAMRVGRQVDCISHDQDGCADWIPDPQQYHQSIGGGPLFIENGAAIQRYAGDTLPCDNEEHDTNFCTNRRPWTAIGVSEDGKTLIVAASSVSKSMWEMTSILLAEGTWHAMKLDGGGSSQLWYRGELLVNSSRPVANAFLVFASPDNCESFCDVKLDSVFRTEIKFLKEAGIVNGFSDGLYHPDANLTRAEMASMLWRWMARYQQPEPCDVHFSDMVPPESPHFESLTGLVCADILLGFGDDTLRPDAPITRGQAVSLVMRILRWLSPGRSGINGPVPEENPFVDSIDGPHADDILLAHAIGLVNGYGDGSFRVDAPIDRGQMAKIVARAIYFATQPNATIPTVIEDYAAAFKRPLHQIDQQSRRAVAWGDVDCDDQVSVGDALGVLQLGVGLRGEATACAGIESVYMPVCDIDLNGECTVGDALKLLRCDVGIASEYCP